MQAQQSDKLSASVNLSVEKSKPWFKYVLHTVTDLSRDTIIVWDTKSVKRPEIVVCELKKNIWQNIKVEFVFEKLNKNTRTESFYDSSLELVSAQECSLIIMMSYINVYNVYIQKHRQQHL